MSTTNPCHHDCDFTDGDNPVMDTGCCTPMPTRRDCGAPVLPVLECDEAEPEIEFNEDTEIFVVFSTLYDENCSPILDENDDAILTQMG